MGHVSRHEEDFYIRSMIRKRRGTEKSPSKTLKIV